MFAGDTLTRFAIFYSLEGQTSCRTERAVRLAADGKFVTMMNI